MSQMRDAFKKRGITAKMFTKNPREKNLTTKPSQSGQSVVANTLQNSEPRQSLANSIRFQGDSPARDLEKWRAKRKELAGVFRNPEAKKKKRGTNPQEVKVIDQAKLVRTGKFERPVTFFPKTSGRNNQFLRFPITPFRDSFPESPQNETDLVIGLDFGSSSVKVVIWDRNSLKHYAVPFFQSGSSRNHFILPSVVWKTNDEYSLVEGTEARRDLKLRLLNSDDSDNNDTKEVFNDACAFLALVLRYCREWFLRTVRLDNHKINWGLNVGLPAKSYEDTRTAELFRRLAWSAINVAASGDELVSYRLVDEFRLLSSQAEKDSSLSRDKNFHFDWADIRVFPEVAAQILGLVRAEKLDNKSNPILMIVDVGAGTVDVALFSVVLEANEPPRFSFFSAEVVKAGGAAYLHRARIRWLKSLLIKSELNADEELSFLDDVEYQTDSMNQVPDNISQYLPGFTFENANPDDFDRTFLEGKLDTYGEDSACFPRAVRCLVSGKQIKGIKPTQLTHLPIFLCGGGATMTPYSRVVDRINSANIGVHVHENALGTPDNLNARDLPHDEYHRLSVAYGLSFFDEAKVIESINIPSVTPKNQSSDDLISENAVVKEHM